MAACMRENITHYYVNKHYFVFNLQLLITVSALI